MDVWLRLLGEVHNFHSVVINICVLPAEWLRTPPCIEQEVVGWGHSPCLEHLGNLVQDYLDVFIHSDHNIAWL